MRLRAAARRAHACVSDWGRLPSSGRAMAVALAMLAAVVAVCAVSVRADSTVPAGPTGAGLGTGLPTGPGSSGPSPEDTARARDKQRQHDAWLSSDQARAERADSRSRYRALDADHALAAARAKYGSLLDAAPMNPLPLHPGDRVERIDSQSARIKAANGNTVLAASTGPLFGAAGSGRDRAIDLRLGGVNGGFAPSNGYVDTLLPASAGGQVRLGDFAFGLGAAADQAGTLHADKVFYANSDVDTDTLLRPLSTGAEVSYELRSPSSAQTLRMTFALPTGAALAGGAGPGAAAQITRDGQALATVSAPDAVDAQGQNVPVDYSVQGNELVMEVAHRDKDYAYPIMVDPAVSVNYQWNSGQRTDNNGWGVYQSNPSAPMCAQLLNGGWGEGLYTYWWPNIASCGTTSTSPSYVTGQVTEQNYYWQFWRRSTAYVFAAWESSRFGPPSDGGVCRYSGIYSLADGWESPHSGAPNNLCDPNAEGSSTALYALNYCTWGDWCDYTHVPPAKPPNYFVFGTQAFVGGPHQIFINYLGAATLFFNDNEPPSVDTGSPSGFPTAPAGTNGWLKQDTTFTGHAHDPGVGVFDLTLSSDNGSTLQNAGSPSPANSTCSVDPASQCGPDATTYPVSTTDLKEGINNITATAHDAIHDPVTTYTCQGCQPTVINHSTSQVIGQIKIDRTAPTIATSGELDWARDEPRVTSDSPDLDANGLDFNDGGTTTSGVKTLKVQIDGADPTAVNPYITDQPQQQGGPTNVWFQPDPNNASAQRSACDSCSLDHDFHFDTSRFANGDHYIDVIATDYAGNVQDQTWHFTIDRTSPEPSCSDPSADPNGCQPTQPSSAAASCTPAPPAPSAPAGTILPSSDAAASQTNTSDPQALAASDSATIEGSTVTPALTTALPLAYNSASTLQASVLGGAAPTYAVGAGSAAACVSLATEMTGAPPPKLENGTAVEYGDTGPSTDTILRPTALGVQELEQIRDAQAPEAQSYQVALSPGQYLKQLPSGPIAIVDPSVPTISSSYNPSPGTATDGIDDGTDNVTQWEADGSSDDPSQYTAQDFAGLTPPDGEIQPTQTQFQYNVDSSMLKAAAQDADGQAVAIISPPFAVDAAGTHVPTAISITGPSSITITTHHLEGQYSYPVMTTHKTTSTTTARSKPAQFGFAVGTPGELVDTDPNTGKPHTENPNWQASPGSRAQPRGIDQILTGLQVPEHQNSTQLPVPSTRFNMTFGACDAYDATGASLVPNSGTTQANQLQADANNNNQTARKCRNAVDFVDNAVNRGMTPYITIFPPPPPSSSGTNVTYPTEPLTYTQSVERLWNTAPFNQVLDWGATNEPDLSPRSFPLNPPVSAAQLWLTMQAAANHGDHGHPACGKVQQSQPPQPCKIVAGEFAYDRLNNDSFNTSYMSYLHSAHATPHVWGFHDYADIVYFKGVSDPQNVRQNENSSYPTLQRFIKNVDDTWKATRPRIWVSESGVVLRRFGNPGHTTPAYGDAFYQTNAAEQFLRTSDQSNQVQLVNYYSFWGSEFSFDSAVVYPMWEVSPSDASSGSWPGYTAPGQRNQLTAWRPVYCVLAKQDTGTCTSDGR